MPKPPSELFKSTMIPAPEGSGKLLEERLEVPTSPVTCLGKTFSTDEERRAYFTEELRKRLAAPEFRKDVSEGKNDPIYNAHSYHTKVPHKAIMRYILHYTNPGDIVFDGFCGTGMTGVAAQMCGNRAEVESLGYKVEDDGKVL
jgi:hypothetical protein